MKKILGRFRTYRKCRLGCDGVAWLTKTLGEERQAMVVGNKMINVGLFRRVAGGHMHKGLCCAGQNLSKMF